MKLKCETSIDLDHEDVAAFLTDEFCGSYSKFEALRVEFVTVHDNGQTFRLTFTPKPEEDAA